MNTLFTSHVPSLNYIPKNISSECKLRSQIPRWSFPSSKHKVSLSKTVKVFAVSSPPTKSTSIPEPELELETKGEKFDWNSEWFPIMPLCDLDKKVPHGKKVLGIDVVVWWDKNENSWKVFDDACPHRLAPLSDGRIDKWGRLQCAYHGWCFDGSGHCKLIPQAPPDGPPVHTFKKACAGVYPSTVQHDIVWFWPNKDPKYKDIIKKKKPPYISELDDPSMTKWFGNRDFPYGYEVLIENLLDPAHVPYAHYGIIQAPPPEEKRDREGGKPIELGVKKLDINGFIGKAEWGGGNFIAPYIYHAYLDPVAVQGYESASSTDNNSPLLFFKQKLEKPKVLFTFFCVPVSPGNSRLIWCFPSYFGNSLEKLVPKWMFHIGIDLKVQDSDLYLLHVEERKIMESGPANWQNFCFVPTNSDAFVGGFRRWLKKYTGGQVDWGGKFPATLSPPLPREQLMDRYWTHVVNCRSCNSAYKGLNAAELVLEFMSICLIGIAAATKQSAMSGPTRIGVVLMGVVCFAASRWLAHFIYKNFHYHDHDHGLL